MGIKWTGSRGQLERRRRRELREQQAEQFSEEPSSRSEVPNSEQALPEAYSRRSRIITAITQVFLAFTKRVSGTDCPTPFNKGCSAFLLGLIGVIICMSIYFTLQLTIFYHLSAGEHLERARAACGGYSRCDDIQEATRELAAIPPSSPVYGAASEMRAAIQRQRELEDKESQENAEVRQQNAREQMNRNFQGQAHDRFRCSKSTDGLPIVSFDGGISWWNDDGRCAEELQRKRDKAAEIDSYWSTTVRVDTDMNSSWLPDEERTCQTFPNERGRIATVRCESTSHANHNIPVKFWGGIDRDTVSDWKCRREGDTFVCRAID